ALAAGHGYLVAVPSRGPGDGSAAGGIDPGLNLVVVGGGEASGEVGVLSESGAPPVPQLQTVRFADPGDAGVEDRLGGHLVAELDAHVHLEVDQCSVGEFH